MKDLGQYEFVISNIETSPNEDVTKRIFSELKNVPKTTFRFNNLYEEVKERDFKKGDGKLLKELIDKNRGKYQKQKKKIKNKQTGKTRRLGFLKEIKQNPEQIFYFLCSNYYLIYPAICEFFESIIGSRSLADAFCQCVFDSYGGGDDISDVKKGFVDFFDKRKTKFDNDMSLYKKRGAKGKPPIDTKLQTLFMESTKLMHEDWLYNRLANGNKKFCKFRINRLKKEMEKGTLGLKPFNNYISLIKFIELNEKEEKEVIKKFRNDLGKITGNKADSFKSQYNTEKVKIKVQEVIKEFNETEKSEACYAKTFYLDKKNQGCSWYPFLIQDMITNKYPDFYKDLENN